MSMEDELEEQRRRAYAQRSPEERKVRADAVAEVADAKSAVQALGTGEVVPEFRLPSITGAVVESRELLGRGPLVISFYRGGWCPYCNIELRALQGRLPEIEALGASLVAISPELPDRAAMNASSNALTFPVLVDQDNQVARRFRLTHQIAPEVVRYQLGNGNDVAAHNGTDVAEVPLPATYVAGADGIVRYAFVDADYTRRADPDVILGVLRALARGDRRPGRRRLPAHR
jgi:peroxiredoxin